MVVIDASVVLEVLLRTPRAAAAQAWLDSVDQTLHAPCLIDVEVAQVLRRYTLHRELGAGRARQALDDLTVLALERYSHEPLMSRIWQLRDNFTAYDAAYVALAEALEAPLLTSDRRLAGAPGVRATICCLA